jgi:LEA14-like dessication related protein
MPTKKTILAIILVALLLVNIVAAAFIFIDIQVLAFPNTTLRVDVIEINTDEIIIHHNIQLYNPNSFEMILRDFQIVARTTDGDEVINMTIEGGSVPGQSHQNYSANDRIVMKGNLSGLLSSTITGVVGFNLFGIITKTIPLKVTVLTSLKEVLNKIAVPDITIRAKFGTITRTGINLTTEIEVSNQNPFGMFIEDFKVDILAETGNNVGFFMVSGATIPAESTVTISGEGSVILEALNAKTLFISLEATAGANIAGVSKSLPLSAQIEIIMPNLEELVPPDKPLELSMDIDLSRTRGGFNGNMTLEVINPTKIPFIANELIVMYYGVKNDKKYLVAEGPFGSGELVPESTTYFYGDMMISYSKLFNFSAGKGFLPDKVFAQLRAKISLPGVTIYIPVAIGSYIDFHLLRPNQ